MPIGSHGPCVVTIAVGHLSGAQEPATFIQAFEKALKE